MTPVLAFEEMRLPLELLSALMIFLLPFGRKKSNFSARMILCFVALTLFSLLYFPVFGDKLHPRFMTFQAIWYVLIICGAILTAKICFVISWCDSLFMAILAFATQNIIYVLLHELLSRTLLPVIREHLLLYILSAVLFCALIFPPVYFVFRRPLTLAGPKLFDDEKRNLVFYSFLLFLTIACMYFYQNLFQNVHLFFTWLVELSFCFFILIIQYSLLRVRSLSVQNEVLEQAMRDNQKYYEMSKETVAIINRKCHDFKHQLKALSMVSDEERNAYIKEAQENILFYQHLVHSENQVINTILAEKGLFCEEKNIALSCTLDDVSLDFIHVPDLYAMLGNGIDNAISYVSQFEEAQMRVINFTIHRKRNFIQIQINNPYRGEPLAPGSLPKTTKSDAGNHGFGLKSIQYLAQKYHGQMDLFTTDGLFTLQVLIPMQ